MPATMLAHAALVLATSAAAAPAPGAGSANIAAQPAAPPAVAPLVASELAARLGEYFTRLGSAGYTGALLVARGGEVVYQKGVGLADPGRKLPITERTVFSVGSITKQYTAAAILKLEQEGKLRVEDTLSKFFPAAPKDKAGITLHQLLTHTAGLRSDYATGDYVEVGRDEYVKRIFAAKLEHPPGARFEYSNAGYSLLGAIIELASGQGYEAYLQEHLFAPAGMHETGYLLPHYQPEEVAHGTIEGRDWGTILEKPWAPDGPWWPLRANGGIHTTLADMLRWNRALDGDAVLNASERTKLFSPHVSEGGGSFYGYGWSVGKTKRGTRVVQHNGGNRVFVAELQRFPDEGVLIFLTSTVAEQTASQVLPDIDRIVFGGKVEAPPRAVALEPKALAQLEGTWRLPKGGSLVVQARGAQLAVAPGDGEALAVLIPGSESPELRALSARARAMIKASVAGDARPLQRELGRMPLAEVEERERGLMEDRVERLGKFKGFQLLGTEPPSAAEGATTHVRMDFARRSVFNHYHWEDGKLVGIEPSPQGPEVLLIPVSANELAAFRTGAASTLRATIERGEDGTVKALRFRSPDGEVRTHR